MSEGFTGPRVPHENSTSGGTTVGYALIFMGVVFQVSVGYAGVMLGLPLVIIGFYVIYYYEWAHNSAIVFTPRLNTEGKQWVNVTDAEFKKLKTKVETIKDYNSSGFISNYIKWVNSGCGACCIGGIGGCLMIIAAMWGLIFLMSAIFTVLSSVATNSDIEYIQGVVFANLVVIALANVLLFKPSLWSPHLLAFKIPVFERLIAGLANHGMGDWQCEFQLEMTESDQGKMPTDIKIVLKPPSAPPEFLGIQGQITINRGGPYMYFVVITKKDLPISIVKSGAAVIEPKQDEQVNILVIRQQASNSGGYITSDQDFFRLLLVAKDSSNATLTT